MNSQKYLFLHYGPGGNAGLERLWLNDWSEVEFWDRPGLPEEQLSLENVARSVFDKWNSGQYEGVIAHSFGFNLYLLMQSKFPIKPRKLIVLAPVLDVSMGFASFARKMEMDKPAQVLEKSMKGRRYGAPLDTEEQMMFWGLIQTILGDPNYFKLYWAQDSNLQKFLDLAAQIKPLHFPSWQKLINESLSVDWLSILTNSQWKASINQLILGAKDPYFLTASEQKNFWEQWGFEVEVITEVAHYPHLEASLACKKYL